MADLDEEIDRIYGLPLEQFVTERDALAKRLRGEKRREDADAVKGLRKPTVAAWAANQVLRSQPDERRALLDAGDALRAAQEELLAGRGDAATARAAAEGERRAVGDLVSAARGLARDEGFLSDAVLDRVRETLHAAATDDDARAEVAAARLDRERRPAAFGGLEGFAVAAPAPAPAPAKPAPSRARRAPEPADRKSAEAEPERDRDERDREREAERERRAAERDRRRELQAAVREAKAAERDAGRRRRESERAAHDAERRYARARADLEAAETAEREASARREAAEQAQAEG